MIEYIKKRKLLVMLIIFLFVLAPLSLIQKAETDKVAVVTAIGLDLQEENILLSANIVVPNSGAAGSGGGTDGTVKTVCVLGEDVSTAFTNLSILIGKMPGLAHCDAVVLNKELFKDNVTKYLDFFVRTNNLTSNANIIVADKEARSVLETSAEQKGVRAVSLSKILLVNNEYTLGEEANIDTFYEKYFTKPSASILPVLNEGDSKVAEAQTTGGDREQNSGDNHQSGNNNQQNSGGQSTSSIGGSGGGKEQSASGRAEKIIKNNGQGVVVKNGQIKAVLDTNQMYDFNLINPNTRKGHIRVSGVTGEGFNDATLLFEIFDKRNKNTGMFLGDVPVFNFGLDLIVKLEEVVMDNIGIDNMAVVKDYVVGNIRAELERQLSRQISVVVELSKSTNTDFLGVYNYFYKFYNKPWKEFLDSLENPDEYLKHIVFTCDFDIEGKI